MTDNEPTREDKNAEIAKACGLPSVPHWYCANCATERDSRDVTFTETCDECGRLVEWIHPPDYFTDPNACFEAFEKFGITNAVFFMGDKRDSLGYRKGWWVKLSGENLKVNKSGWTRQVFGNTQCEAMAEAIWMLVK